MIRATMEAAVMTPNPPNWIRTRIMICPNLDQYIAVVTVVRPVTHIADVAVNSASIGLPNGHLPLKWVDLVGRFL